ncbi:MAG: DUF488 family protein [Methanomassiliicoccus sp.]|nr:DUF488 family protein [Methanomassiliicoccus sp.]
MLRMRRAYEPPSEEDGTRVLVERLWPRGVSKQRASIDIWCKEAAPSAELRKWYGHEPSRWEAFRERYLQELRGNPAVDRLRRLSASTTVTLVFSTRDVERSGARVLMDLLVQDADQAVL